MNNSYFWARFNEKMNFQNVSPMATSRAPAVLKIYREMFLSLHLSPRMALGTNLIIGNAVFQVIFIKKLTFSFLRAQNRFLSVNVSAIASRIANSLLVQSVHYLAAAFKDLFCHLFF